MGAAALLLAASLAAAQPACPVDDCLVFPADAGVIDVRAYGATGDGVTDDTAAIRAAIRASDEDFGTAWWHNRIVYFPPGTYLVSDTLDKRLADGRYRSGMVLVGAGRRATTLRLKDRAPGYADALRPKAVIYTSSTLLAGSPTAGGKDYLGKGEGNDAYANYVEHMTIDVGQGNAGAVAIDYLANNVGALRDLSIVAPAGSGAVGIAMERAWPGPALLSNLTVSGFDVGIAAARTEYGITMDGVRLSGQRTLALRNNGNMLSIRGLEVDGAAAGIHNLDARGMVAASELRFTGAAGSAELIVNRGWMHLRQARTSRPGICFGQACPQERALDGLYAGDALQPGAAPAWSLPVRQPPAEPAPEPPARWANVQDYGAVPDGLTDSGPAIQRALRSGASTIYFPYGDYAINDTVDVPPGVRRLEGMMSTITVRRYNSASFWLGGGIFRIAGDGPPLTIRRLAFDMMNRGGKLAIEHRGATTLVLQDVVSAGIAAVDRAAGGGELFGENLCCGPISVAGPAGVWLRQFDTEGSGVRITNNGAPLWLLGLKMEQNATAVQNGPGAATDVFGGLLYLVQPPATQRPAFVNRSGRLQASYVESAYIPGATHGVLLDDQTPGAERSVPGSGMPARGLGRIVPRLVSAD